MEKNGLGWGRRENRTVLEKLLDGSVFCCIEFYHWHRRRISRSSVLAVHKDVEAARQEIVRKVQIPIIRGLRTMGAQVKRVAPCIRLFGLSFAYVACWLDMGKNNFSSPQCLTC